VEGFGLTEASPITHLNPLLGVSKNGSIGLPFPDTDAAIVDMEVGSIPLPPGKIGEMIVRGPQVMSGYWNRPDETASVLRNGWLYTGDIAYMDEEGYFFIVDRKKDLIITGGYNVYPREIDEVLHEHPAVKEAVCVGINHRTRGEIVKAYIVPREGHTLTKAEILAFCREKLANYKVPKQVEFRDALPKSIVGKVLRRVIREEEERRGHTENDMEEYDEAQMNNALAEKKKTRRKGAHKKDATP
jgi:long-chain acyl-CoA synthetase